MSIAKVVAYARQGCIQGYLLFTASVDILLLCSILFIESGALPVMLVFLPMLLLSYNDYQFSHQKLCDWIEHIPELCSDWKSERRVVYWVWLLMVAVMLVQAFLIYAGGLYYNLLSLSYTLFPIIGVCVHALLSVVVLASSITHMVNVWMKLDFFFARIAAFFQLSRMVAEHDMQGLLGCVFLLSAAGLGLFGVSAQLNAHLYNFELFCKVVQMPCVVWPHAAWCSILLLSLVSYCQLIEHVIGLGQSTFGVLRTLCYPKEDDAKLHLEKSPKVLLLSVLSFLGVCFRTYVSLLSVSHVNRRSLRLKAALAFASNDKKYHRHYGLSVLTHQELSKNTQQAHLSNEDGIEENDTEQTNREQKGKYSGIYAGQ